MIEHSCHQTGITSALVIDPYQRKVHEIKVTSDRASWSKALSGNPIGPIVLMRNDRATRSVLLLAGDEASTKKPVPPQFRIQPDKEERPIIVTGYGLILSADLTKGKWLACRWSPAKFASTIWWEHWEQRLDPAHYFPELTRNPECWLKG
jgi:hypothetical protein